MMQCIAFPEPAVPRETPLGSVEPAVNWYLESTRREAIAGRAQINQLYAAFQILPVTFSSVSVAPMMPTT
jgi:hypothetical protein